MILESSVDYPQSMSARVAIAKEEIERFQALVSKQRVWTRQQRGEAVLRGEGWRYRVPHPPPATQCNCPRMAAFRKPHFRNEEAGN